MNPSPRHRQPLNRRFILIFLVIFAVSTLISLLVFRQQIDKFIVLPLLSFFAYLNRLWRSFDPDTLWAGFIMLTYVLTLMTFPTIITPQRVRRSKQLPANAGQLRFWIQELHGIYNQGQRITPYSQIELKKLVIEVVAFRQQCSARQAEKWLRANESDLPAEIHTLFHRDTASRQRPGFLGNLERLWNQLNAPSLSTNILKTEAIVRFLESQMEITHDVHRNP